MPDPMHPDEVAFQCAIAVGALLNVAANVKNADTTDLFCIAEAFQALSESIKTCGRST